jgi:hypothetical protein
VVKHMLLYRGANRKAIALVTGNIWKINAALRSPVPRCRTAASKDDPSAHVGAPLVRAQNGA